MYGRSPRINKHVKLKNWDGAKSQDIMIDNQVQPSDNRSAACKVSSMLGSLCT